MGSKRIAVFAALLVLLFYSSYSLGPIGNAAAKEGDVYPVFKTDWGHFTTTTIKETNGHLSGGVFAGDGDNDGMDELVIAIRDAPLKRHQELIDPLLHGIGHRVHRILNRAETREQKAPDSQVIVHMESAV